MIEITTSNTLNKQAEIHPEIQHTRSPAQKLFNSELSGSAFTPLSTKRRISLRVDPSTETTTAKISGLTPRLEDINTPVKPYQKTDLTQEFSNTPRLYENTGGVPFSRLELPEAQVPLPATRLNWDFSKNLPSHQNTREHPSLPIERSNTPPTPPIHLGEKETEERSEFQPNHPIIDLKKEISDLGSLDGLLSVFIEQMKFVRVGNQVAGTLPKQLIKNMKIIINNLVSDAETTKDTLARFTPTMQAKKELIDAKALQWKYSLGELKLLARAYRKNLEKTLNTYSKDVKGKALAKASIQDCSDLEHHLYKIWSTLDPLFIASLAQ